MIDHDKYFEILNNKLKNAKESLTLYTVGGYALKCFGLKTTMDIDAFYDTNETIEKIIKEIGDEYKINPIGEQWINKAVAYLKDPRIINPGKEFSTLLKEYSNLLIYRANLDYLLAMKTFAVYDNKKDKVKHLEDCKKILTSGKISIRNVKDFKELFIKLGYTEIDDLEGTMKEILEIYLKSIENKDIN